MGKRYVNRIATPNLDVDKLSAALGDYMVKEGFSLVDYKGQKAWKKGVGMMTAPQYLVLSYAPGEVTLEAFIRTALLPGVYVGESGIDGFYGAIPKSMLKKRVETVEGYINDLIAQFGAR